jgi:hypothetical protein
VAAGKEQVKERETHTHIVNLKTFLVITDISRIFILRNTKSFPGRNILWRVEGGYICPCPLQLRTQPGLTKTYGLLHK